jgi:hypothetical protein
MFAETQGRRPLALGEVAGELQLTAQGDTCPDPFGLASLGVADRLGKLKRSPAPAAGTKRTPSSSPRTTSSRPTVQSPTVTDANASWGRASRRCGPVGIAPRLKTGNPIARSSAVSRCSPRPPAPPAQQPAPRAPRDHRRRLRRVVRRCRPPTPRQVQPPRAPPEGYRQCRHVAQAPPAQPGDCLASPCAVPPARTGPGPEREGRHPPDGQSSASQTGAEALVIHGGAQALLLRLLLVARSLDQRSKALPGRREDIEGDTALLAGDGAVGNVRWNHIDIAWMEDAPFSSKLKLEGSFKDGADLFLSMLVNGSHRVGLEVDEADIHAVPEHRSDDNAGFNGQRRDVPLEVQVRGPERRVKLVVICRTKVGRFRRHRFTSRGRILHPRDQEGQTARALI